ncbi:hypothetical protein IL306_014560 [Fusarium sp. DS 682]|nr:hypothetical protein IL306_014560 [Fusarium sp. DS 682]
MSLALNEPSRHSPSGSLNSSLPSSGVPVSDGKSPAARRSSFVNTFNLAKSCLEANGIVRPAEKDDLQGPNRAQSLVLEKPLAFMFEDCVESILELEYDRARRLFSTFADTIYPIYPCVDLDSAGWLLDALFGRATREGNNHTSQSPPINVTKVDILKALLGLTLLVEDDTTSPLGRHIQRHVDWTVEKLVTGTGPDTDDIVMATLMGASAPFLTVTIEYTRLASEITGSLKPSAKSAVENRQRKEYLDYKVQCLRDKFRDLTAIAQSSDSSHQDSVLMDDLETFLAVRVNHARMMLRKPLLHSYLGDREKQQAAAVSIECAKDAVFLCSRVISKPAPSKCLRGAYEYFLVSSLAIILLIVSQDPRTYGPDSREAFQEAIKILEASKCQHFGSQNLCFTFEQLIKIGEHLYMPKDDNMSVSQDFGDVDLGQFLFDPQCAAPRKSILFNTTLLK